MATVGMAMAVMAMVVMVIAIRVVTVMAMVVMAVTATAIMVVITVMVTVMLIMTVMATRATGMDTVTVTIITIMGMATATAGGGTVTGTVMASAHAGPGGRTVTFGFAPECRRQSSLLGFRRKLCRPALKRRSSLKKTALEEGPGPLRRVGRYALISDFAGGGELNFVFTRCSRRASPLKGKLDESLKRSAEIYPARDGNLQFRLFEVQSSVILHRDIGPST